MWVYSIVGSESLQEYFFRVFTRRISLFYLSFFIRSPREVWIVWLWNINRIIIVMIWKSEDGTLWESAIQMNDKRILNAAGWIVSKFWLPQRQIDQIKYAILWFLREKSVCPIMLETILLHISHHRDKVVALLGNKPCIDGRPDRAQNFIEEFVSRIESVLAWERVAGDSEWLDIRELKNRRHTFPLENDQRIIVFPVNGWYQIQIRQWSQIIDNYLCADYYVHRDESWRYIATYDRYGDRIYSYTAFDSPYDRRR